MGTLVNGLHYSDLLVGVKEDVTDDLLELAPAKTAFLNSIGFPGEGGIHGTTHLYQDDYYIPGSTTLNGTIAAGAVVVIFTDAVFKSNQRIECEGEIFTLGATLDNLTFACTRSTGTLAAAQHLTGKRCYGLGKSEPQGTPAGNADVGYEPNQVTTYIRTHERVIEVPDQTNKELKYGRPKTTFDQEVINKMRDIKLEAEEASLFDIARAPVPSSGTPGNFNGLYERVQATNTTAMGATDITQSDMRTMVEAVGEYYDPDLDINAVMLCPIRQMFVFDGWQQAHIEIAPSDPLVQTYGVRVRRLQIGPMVIDVIPYGRLKTNAFLYQPQYIKPRNMTTPTFEMLPREGRQTRGFVHFDWTLEVYCPPAHYMLTGLKYS